MSSIAKASAALAAAMLVHQMVVLAIAIPLPLPAGGRELSPDVHAYNEGIEHRNRALQAETRAAKARTAADSERYLTLSRKEYEAAFEKFSDSAEINPGLPQAWNGRGFVYRKLGQHANALISYDRALKLAPDYTDAIEYRGEALLALNRLDDAKEAYLRLFAMDRQQADMLLSAMRQWIASRKSDPAGVEPATISAFEAWVQERAAIAQETRLMSSRAVHRPW